MAEWRKVIVSGSNVELNHISASGNIIPITTDESSLGSVDHNFSDLFLDSGGVINFDSGNVTITHSSNKLTFNKAIDVDAGVTVDNITIDGTEIDLSSGTLTMDIADDMVIDVDGGNLDVKDNDQPMEHSFVFIKRGEQKIKTPSEDSYINTQPRRIKGGIDEKKRAPFPQGLQNKALSNSSENIYGHNTMMPKMLSSNNNSKSKNIEDAYNDLLSRRKMDISMN